MPHEEKPTPFFLVLGQFLPKNALIKLLFFEIEYIRSYNYKIISIYKITVEENEKIFTSYGCSHSAFILYLCSPVYLLYLHKIKGVPFRTKFVCINIYFITYLLQ